MGIEGMGINIIRQPKAGRISTWMRCHYFVILLACLLLSADNIYLSVSTTTIEDFDDQTFQEPRRQQQSDRQNVHVVVSHCDQSLGWIWKDLEEENKRLQPPPPTKHELKSVTIISKCNVTIPLDDLPGPEPLVQILSLPNVGREGHSYAYWIKEVLLLTTGKDIVGANNAGYSQKSQTEEAQYKLLYSNHQDKSYENGNPFWKIARMIDPADMVFFLKDKDSPQWKDPYYGTSLGLLDMFDQLAPDRVPPITIDISSSVSSSRPITPGFGCQLYFSSKRFIRNAKRDGLRMTPLAHRSIVWDFTLDEYKLSERDETGERFQSLHRPMGNWINHLHQQIEHTDNNINNNNNTSHLLFSKEYYEQVKNTNFTMPENVNLWPFSKPDLVPLCFTGIFVTYWGQVASTDSALTTLGWIAIAKSLSRGNNIEEGHYMERWWADLLSFSSWADQMIVQRQSATSTSNNKITAFKNDSRVSGIPLSEAEQQLLLQNESFAISFCTHNGSNLEGSKNCSVMLDFENSFYDLV